MHAELKTKRRGFVMTGGGAKGLYEAGVIHAFHLCGLEFDVITGSSIGAMNSAFYAEYQYTKRSLPPETLQDALKSIDALDAYVRAFHHAWLKLPELHLIDDREEAPLGRLKNDLLGLDVRLADLVRLAWWYTDPQRKTGLVRGLGTALLRLGREGLERLGSFANVQGLAQKKEGMLRQIVRSYLGRFGLERSLIPPENDRIIQNVFTQDVTPLTRQHLQESVLADEPGMPTFHLIQPGRFFSEYTERGIDLRLTRANYRTGRLEISTCHTEEEFVRYLRNQAWRLKKEPLEKIPLTSLRLELPGDPSVVDAALASGRFPGVFKPFSIQDIYPQGKAQNDLLYQMLSFGLHSPGVLDGLRPAFQLVHGDAVLQAKQWEQQVRNIQDNAALLAVMPVITDTYVDGGAIDNTPSNSAIDATRQWIERAGRSKRDVVLDLYVIFLEPEPKVEPDEARDPSLVDVVQRTLAIQSAAKESSDAVTVDTINQFGQQGETLGRALLGLVQACQQALPGLDAAQQDSLAQELKQRWQEIGLPSLKGKNLAEILAEIQARAARVMDQGLPLHVNEVKIYPESMPLSTLQFTERFGYRKDNALKMISMGCYQAIWALRAHLESADSLDEVDHRALELARRWMGQQEWPAGRQERQQLHQSWQCQRVACIFHAGNCVHGAGQSIIKHEP